MIRSVASKVAWVGRTASMVFGLALVMALVLGVATMAFGANGQNFILGKLNNAATKVTGLVGNVDGAAALRVTNPNAGTNDTALDLRVQTGEAPMKVNSSTRVANLNAATAGRADSAASADNAGNADNLDNLDSAAYQKRVSSFCPQNSSIQVVNGDGTVACEDNAATAGMAGYANNAGNADKLDNKDSTVFRIRTAHAKALAHDCDTPAVWNECAPVTVTVPSGSKYIVSVWSSFSARMPDGTSESVEYCSAGKGPSIDVNNPCITPYAVKNAVWVESPGLTAASSSGDTNHLEPGTYTFFTAIRPPVNQFHSHSSGHVITKVLVRDVANSF